MKLKDRFLIAIIKGELISEQTEQGRIITLKQFARHFSYIGSQCTYSFLPNSTVETGRGQITRTKFVRRIKKGVYLIPNEVIDDFKKELDKDKPD